MSTLSTTRMSSKGQVVIPEEIRQRLGLKTGAQFVVVGDHDTVILKAIYAPTLKGLGTLMTQARKQARKAGVRPRKPAAACCSSIAASSAAVAPQ